jgi:hypothetical protein
MALLPLALALKQYRALPTPYRIVACYLVYTLLCNGIAKWLASEKITNLPLLHADTLVETSFFILFYYKSISHMAIRKFCRLLLLLFPIACIVNSIFVQSIFHFNTYTRPLGALVILLLCFLSIWHETNATTDGKAFRLSISWVRNGLLIYFGSSFLIFLFSNVLFIHATPQQNAIVWNVHATFVLIQYFFLPSVFIHAGIK